MSRKPTPIRGDRGRLHGSVGQGAQAPKAAPQGSVQVLPAPESSVRKPALPPIPGTGMVESFRAHGVSDPRGAADYLTMEYLTTEGRFEVPPPMWQPAPAMVTRSLLFGSRDLYEIDTNSAQYLHGSNSIAEAVEDMEARFPYSGDCTRSILTDRLTYVDAFDTRPVHPEGKYSQVGHEFTWTLGDDDAFRPGAPTTVGEVDELLAREDRMIRSVRDVAVGASLRGDVALSSGHWRFDHEALAREVMSTRMSADTRYQLLALIYSDGSSTNTGFDSVWAAGRSVPQPGRDILDWLSAHGLDGEWFSFGSWAARFRNQD